MLEAILNFLYTHILISSVMVPVLSSVFGAFIGALTGAFITRIGEDKRQKNSNELMRKNQDDERILKLEELIIECIDKLPHNAADLSSEEFFKFLKVIVYKNKKGGNMAFRFGRFRIGEPINKSVIGIGTDYKSQINIFVVIDRVVSPIEFELLFAKPNEKPNPDWLVENIEFIDIGTKRTFNSCAEAIEKGIELAEEYIQTGKISDPNNK